MEPHSSKTTCDKEDTSKKSLKLLMDSLKKLPKSNNIAKQSPQRSSKKSTPRKRGLKCDENHQKITKWVRKDNQDSKVQKSSHFKPLDVTIKTEKVPKQKKGKTLERTPSFEKYGVVVPSFQKIVADQKKFEEHKQAVLKLDALVGNLLDETPMTDCLQESEEFSEELLDCKHMSTQDLDEAFKRHLKTLVAIKNGEKFSTRHDIFNKGGAYVTPANDLRCSASLTVFTQQQKEHLLDLLRVELDPDEKCTGYFFKVLLPELCLRIFKNEHKMSKRKAKDYLDRRPLDI